MNNIGQRLRALRIEHGYSQEEMAKLIDVERSTYVKYENNKNRPTRKLSEIARIFGVSTDYLLGNTDEKTPPSASAPAARPLTLEEKERAIKEWFTAIAKATGNEKALDAIDKIHLVESTGQLRLADTSDLNNSLLQLQAASLLQVLEKAQKEGKTAAEWHTPQEKE
ncbi:MAG: helix-turn-helix domain-containing protein [Bacteroidales bacterium]|nr:helix-turn-helix domain-containing protein [Bacteroidales bacterium]